jgi:hypothetical protein
MAILIVRDTEREGKSGNTAVQKCRRDTADSGVITFCRLLMSATISQVAVLGKAAATATSPSLVKAGVSLQTTPRLSDSIWKLTGAAYRRKGKLKPAGLPLHFRSTK